MEREAARVREASGADLREMERLHELRLELKRLRYTIEIAGPCVEKGRRTGALAMLADVQKMLGEINDDAILVERLGGVKGFGKKDRAAIGMVVEATGKELGARHGEFLKEWARLMGEGFVERVAGVETRRLAAPAAMVEAKPVGLNGTHKSAAGAARENGRVGGGGKSRRLAAIDVGTNSIRLIVAEAQADGAYRILDDEKEITRLGKGLGKTGKLDAGAMEHTAVTIARMRSIAEGYGAGEIRVVGTSAAREAKNTKELARAIREKAGLEFEVISGEEEAVLAYRSAARAFDLSGTPGAVVDIGGGSTEIVLSAPASAAMLGGRAPGALIERVYTLPLGAVRMTEMFGGAEACGRERFEEMRSYIKQMLSTRVGRPTTPQMVIGTGGTFTTLGAMVQQRDMGRPGDGLFSGGVQGMEVARADLKHLLAYLRKQPVKERTRVPGLSADRADIIVAGLAIVDGVMKWCDANRVRVHEGGIRDGILLGMVGDRGAEGGEGKRDPMRAVRRLAKACAYEAAHSKHVTGLALSIFDQLRDGGGAVKAEEGMRLDDEARLLLEAAAMLHDIGYLINYAQHHKHSYHLIVHADMGGLTTRQVRVVANVARYHRAAEPKMKHGNFAALSVEDRGLVRRLSGILRIADGLDRTHMQSVESVGVRVKKGEVEFAVGAEREPSVDVWGAVRKCGLFEGVFGVKCAFEWCEDAGGKLGPIDRERVESSRPARY
jgi:exopolyphosphatase/guanosine-5'-triphosphate,3'-diphosphate pyrophosphatase